MPKFAFLRKRRRHSRRYSLGFMAVALVGICLWDSVSGPKIDQGSFLAKGSIQMAVAPNGALQLAELDSDEIDGEAHSDREQAQARARRLFMRVEDDVFTMEQRRHGAVILHCIGLLYMFVAIMIVCDECFVPALEVITEVLDLSPDVAGATFMAAGGSAPEFFTSLIGAVVVESDIGTGTIIGSAVFNVLFVIGACALVAPEPLQLTWFPLARDSCFYLVDLFVVTYAFIDEEVIWQEALVLFVLYVLYATFMKFSERVQDWTRSSAKVGAAPKEEADEPRWADSRENMEDGATHATVVPSAVPMEAVNSAKLPRANSNVIRTDSTMSNTPDKRKNFRHKSLQTAGHLPRSCEHHEEEEHHRHHDADDNAGNSASTCVPEDSSIVAVNSAAATPTVPLAPGLPYPTSTTTEMELTSVVPSTDESQEDIQVTTITALDDRGLPSAPAGAKKPMAEEPEEKKAEAEEEEEENEPMSIRPPGADASAKDWVVYVLTIPIVFCLFVTVPDVRRDGFRRYYAVTFVMSICWIAVFTSVMVWFAQIIATTCGMADHIMGLTILAAGTSVPDLITSMIVARQGHGDMAISSSIGSNIFDVTIGLPIPWLLYSALNDGSPVKIKNEGLEISVLMLMAMLGFTIGIVVMHGWVMTKWMGGSLMVLYLIFEVVSVGLTFAPEGSLKLIKA